MKISKIGYISHLAKLSKGNKELQKKIILLAAGEFGLDEKDISDISELKRILDLNVDPKEQTSLISSKGKIHNPRNLVLLLERFTVNPDTDNFNHLKFTTHPWDLDDSVYPTISDFFEHLAITNEKGKTYIYNQIRKIEDIDRDLFRNKIFPFVFQNRKSTSSADKTRKKEYKWGKHNIRIGWQFPENLMLNWGESNYDNKNSSERRTPFEMDIPQDLRPNHQIEGKSITKFKDVVELFKKEIKFRRLDLYLYTLQLVNEVIPNHRIEGLDNLKNKEFYTNTERVLNGIKGILQMISEESVNGIHNHVVIEANYDYSNPVDSFVQIKIIHQGSFAKKPTENFISRAKSGQGQLDSIRKLFFNLCSFSIRSIFEESGKDTIAELIYLEDGSTLKTSTPRIERAFGSELSCTGFEYILKFPI